MRAASWGLSAVVAVVGLALTAMACVNLSYPPGASRNADGGLVLHLPNGQRCNTASECQNGFCVDNVCCNEACAGKCFTCARADSPGFCSMAEKDTDRRNECDDLGPGQCSTDGVCDGQGNCETYAQGTVCKPALCDLAIVTPASRCDDKGTCVTPTKKESCSPFNCSGVTQMCLTSCEDSLSCVGANQCVNNTCGAKAFGTTCQAGTECASGFCVDGVCCTSDCTGGCRSCNIKDSVGICTAIPAGVAPKDASCPTMDASTCQQDGTCDGAGACRLFYPAGAVCGPASCSTATLHPASTCDGKGKCQTPAVVTCGSYTCGSTTACRTTCGGDADCASPSVCQLSTTTCGGLTAQFFRQTNLTDLAYTHTDPWINFNWGGGAPMGLNVDNFSIRWRGKITARFSDTYTFYSGSDDGERLYVNGQLLIDRYVRHASVPEDVSKTIALTAGQPTDIVFEYFENGGDANVYLSWQSAHEPKAVVPTSALSPQ
ncbi:MAG TPA: PA14 domain-containing protein [Polyangia bacterium]|nr:PA14 domain-containing protein [Polyangia bacterium]